MSSEPLTVAEILTQLTRCPDCDSAAEFVAAQPGVLNVKIHHDETCPQWRAMTREGEQ